MGKFSPAAIKVFFKPERSGKEEPGWELRSPLVSLQARRMAALGTTSALQIWYKRQGMVKSSTKTPTGRGAVPSPLPAIEFVRAHPQETEGNEPNKIWGDMNTNF